MVTKRVLAVLTCVSLAGCSGSQEDSDEPSTTPKDAPASSDTSDTSDTPTASETPEETTETEPSYETVSAEPFKIPGSESHIAILTPLAGVNYFCLLSDANISCDATAPADVPNLEDMPGRPWGPFTGRPTSVIFAPDGEIIWGIVEGVPFENPDTPLQPGQRVEFNGAWCQVPDDASIQCGFGNDSFTVAGPDRTFSQP